MLLYAVTRSQLASAISLPLRCLLAEAGRPSPKLNIDGYVLSHGYGLYVCSVSLVYFEICGKYILFLYFIFCDDSLMLYLLAAVFEEFSFT